MSKKHFIALADVLRQTEPVISKAIGTSSPYGEGIEAGRMQQWMHMRDTLADFCQAQNGNFKRDQWIDCIEGKCGSSGGAIHARK